MNFLRYFLIIIITIVLIILGFGFRSDGYFEEDYSVNLTFRKDFLYKIIEDPLKYPKIKFALENIEVLEQSKKGTIWKWRENHKFMFWNYQKTFELETFSKSNYRDVKITENDLGYVGTISYNFFYDENKGTTVNIKSKIFVENLFLRGLYVIRGTNVFSAGEVKWIRVGIGKQLLETL